MRICSICTIEKPLNEFSKDRTKTAGYSYKCKCCAAKIKLKERRTPQGLSAYMLQGQRHRSIKKGWAAPSHTLAEFREWLFNQPNFEKLFNDWVNAGYDKWLKPSVDRVDDNIPYILSNMQLLTWQENEAKYKYRNS